MLSEVEKNRFERIAREEKRKNRANIDSDANRLDNQGNVIAVSHTTVELLHILI